MMDELITYEVSGTVVGENIGSGDKLFLTVTEPSGKVQDLTIFVTRDGILGNRNTR